MRDRPSKVGRVSIKRAIGYGEGTFVIIDGSAPVARMVVIKGAVAHPERAVRGGPSASSSVVGHIVTTDAAIDERHRAPARDSPARFTGLVVGNHAVVQGQIA